MIGARQWARRSGGEMTPEGFPWGVARKGRTRDGGGESGAERAGLKVRALGKAGEGHSPTPLREPA